MSQQQWCIGLTGGIGSGKSTAGQFFAELGAVVIEADSVSRKLTSAGGSAIAPICNLLGKAFLQSDGSLDRQKTRDLIFRNTAAKHELEKILHPLIRSTMRSLALQAWADGNQVAIMDIPLLAENPYWWHELDRIFVVDCEESTQITRVMRRNSFSYEQVRQIMQSQTNRLLRLACADMVLWNDKDDLMNLRQQVTSSYLELGL